MKVLFYAAKQYDRDSFDSVIKNYTDIEIDYIDSELDPLTASLAKGYDAVCAFVSADVGAKTLTTLNELGVKTVLMRCAGYNNVDVKYAYGKIHILHVQGNACTWLFTGSSC